MKSFFFGNWKMNMRAGEVDSFVQEFCSELSVEGKKSKALDVIIGFAPPYTSIASLRDALRGNSDILLGAQNVHWLEAGAHTGEISLSMLKELGVQFVILGHSERRQFYGETNGDVSQRTRATLEAGLIAIVCIGESKEQFEAKQTMEVVKSQLQESLSGIDASLVSSLLIAYEPIWAIGTGLAATPQIAGEVHDSIRASLESMYGKEIGSHIPLLYGGSTTSENVAELMAQANINGSLVGGASLKSSEFAALVRNGSHA